MRYKDQRISSPLIRQCRQAGDIDTASLLLSTRKQVTFEQRAG
ncbi:hypothetical protein [Pseudomonas cavernicola]|nr:hypothetical protein [Pseudomonas cavernicola]